MKTRLLVVDDEESLAEFLHLLFEKEGYDVQTAGSVEQARRQLEARTFDLVLCDILMPDGNGLELLREIKTRSSSTEVIMMTAYASHKSAVEAMKLGAYNYITKPFNDVEELTVLAARALEKTGLEVENVYLRNELARKYQFSNIIGSSPRMQEVFSLIERVAKTTSTVLISGESGTGKELIARAVHYSGPRSQHHFLSINCGAMPENLLESELFGHEKGAFTGAVREKQGLFHEAAQGTLFLDEIGDMTPAMQVKLLRVLQDKKIRRVGGNREVPVDVRIIAATNLDLQERIGTGDFREDLYYRINVIPISLPPLRARREDIAPLIEFFVKKFSEEQGLERKPVSKRALELLQGYHWPGNVRQLENTIERALTLGTGRELTSDDLPPQVRNRSNRPPQAISLPKEGMELEPYLDEIRRDLMRQALERSDGVQTQAAEILSISFRSFRYYAKKLELTGSPD